MARKTIGDAFGGVKTTLEEQREVWADAVHPDAITAQVLAAVLEAVTAACEGRVPAPVRLDGLPASELALVNQVLGEGEVSAQVLSVGSSATVPPMIAAGMRPRAVAVNNPL